MQVGPYSTNFNSNLLGRHTTGTRLFFGDPASDAAKALADAQAAEVEARRAEADAQAALLKAQTLPVIPPQSSWYSLPNPQNPSFGAIA